MEPHDFSSIIGHEKVLRVLEKAVNHDTLAHAYLFVGPEGVGRTTVARALFSTLSSQGGAGSLDTVHVERLLDEKTGKRKQVVSVKQIRKLREQLATSSLPGAYKLVFIEEADCMHSSAANALLKTLEEPLGKTVIILRAPNVSSVPATIASRCQILRFHPVHEEKMHASLVERGLGQDAARDLVSLSVGRPGWAISLSEDIEQQAERQMAKNQFTRAINGSLADRLKFAAELVPKDEVNKVDYLSDFLGMWEQVLHEMLAQRVQAQQVDPGFREKWAKGVEALFEARRALRANVQPQLCLEHVLLAF